MKVLIACEFSGIVRDAFAELGHNAWSCDLLPTERPGQHFQCDVRNILDRGWDLMIAHPPCTYLTARGRYRATQDQRSEAERFFVALASCRSIPKICVENPRGVMSTLYRKPDQIIHPWQFGHPTRKTTCLWLVGLPALCPSATVEPEAPVHIDTTTGKKRYSLDYLPGNADRDKIRSRTFQGIADAMALQWGT